MELFKSHEATAGTDTHTDKGLKHNIPTPFYDRGYKPKSVLRVHYSLNQHISLTQHSH